MRTQISLREILDGKPAQTFGGALDVPVADLQYDVRKVRHGSAFFAFPGVAGDGHNHITTALERGAVAIVYERPMFRPPRVAAVRVRDSRMAMARAAEVFYGHPERQLTVIGVTGGEARSSGAFLVRRLLQKAGVESGLVGSIVDEYGERAIPKFGVMPEALDAQRLMVGMVRGGCAACVLEVRPWNVVAQNSVTVRCDIAVFVHGMGQATGFGTQRGGASESCVLGLAPKAGQKRFSAVVCDHDDAAAAACGRSVRASRIVTCGTSQSSAVHLQECWLHTDGARLRLKVPGGLISAAVPILHRDDLRALVGAVGVAVAFDVPLCSLRDALADVTAVPGHLEPVDCGQPFRVFVDSARRKTGLSKALAVLRQTGRGRLLLVFGAGADHTHDERVELGEVAARLVDHAIVTADNPCCESPEEIASEVLSGMRRIKSAGFEIECDRRAAIAKAMNMAKRGDTILIAGKGHVTCQEVNHAIVPFDDRVYVRESLEVTESLERSGHC
ncbi:MAG: UDP-N-acetylmuramyl-tripeptide synthetase [Verrucomicrobiota bacterium]|nr:UDP-N-acetylmuramyl-tripeptide synthetase [Verrucomicrobiota bacterium]